MSRILFAAAREARIQVMYRRGWIPAVAVRTDGMYKYRIHPDDAHLGYGPISTALRNDALKLPPTDSDWFSGLSLHTDGDLHSLTPNDLSMLLLLVAEALADEGM
tara:strand:- start:1409 stop:1723 length:315 start_codon:yes stop_codon:yes gene_type:complete